VPDMHYLVLECLAERTLSTRYEAMVAGGKGYDPRSTFPSFLPRETKIFQNVALNHAKTCSTRKP
jgi:hypothetical protein